MGKYGPFASILAIAAALVASFSFLLLKAVGPVRHWIRQTGEKPGFAVTTGARALAVALIAATYVLIDKTNYPAFLVASGIFGIVTMVFIARFDRLRRVHVHQVSEVTTSGAPARTWWGKAKMKTLIIGTEGEMLPDAKKAFQKAREKYGGVSLTDFMSGFGHPKLNNPAAIWSNETLAAAGNRLIIALMIIFLSAVMALYLAAASVEVTLRA